jgi:hypothetical protein
MSGQPMMISPDQVASIDERGHETGFGWESPRWRNPDAAAQRGNERERRFHNAPAPGQRGAIDDYRTIRAMRDQSAGANLVASLGSGGSAWLARDALATTVGTVAATDAAWPCRSLRVPAHTTAPA